MTAVGFTWCVSGLAVDSNSYVFAVGFIFGALPFAVLFHMLSRSRPAGWRIASRSRSPRSATS